MKKWKALVTGIFVFCLLPWSFVWAEEEGEETEDPYPDSYYYTIESNETVNWPQGPAIEAA